MTISLGDIRSAENGNGTPVEAPAYDSSGIAVALDVSRVDLLQMIANGIPERKFIPGTGGALVRGKRHHVAGEAKAGKTIALALVAAIDAVAAGATVAILDRENGAEEYGRRLAAILDARGGDDAFRKAIGERYRYHAWPDLALEWGQTREYAQAFAGADLVIFDSSRRFLTSVGLTEDGSDDFSKFTDGLIDPLMLAGIATMILDNTGHGDKDRPRGTSSKADLCDIMYSLRSVEKFGLHRAGKVELVCTHSRIGEIDGTWTLELGGGIYGSWRRQTGADALALFRVGCVAALRVADGPLGREALLKSAREHGAKGRSDTMRGWLDDLLGEPSPAIVHKPGIGYMLTPYPGSGSCRVTEGGGDRRRHDPGTALKAAGVMPLRPLTPSRGKAPACNCADGGAELTEDGRCSRCFGVLR